MLEFIIILVVLPLTLVTLKAITERYIAANAELLMVKFIAEPSRENLDKAEDYMADSEKLNNVLQEYARLATDKLVRDSLPPKGTNLQ